LVKRGPIARTKEIESSIMTLLNRPENLNLGLTFDEIRRALASLPEGDRIGSPNTLSKALKTLVQNRLIERDIETRRYRVPEGMPSVVTHELRRRDLISTMDKSEEFSVFRDSTHEKGIMWGFIDRQTGGQGSNCITAEKHEIFDSILGHITRGILDLARGRKLFDEAYFNKMRHPREIKDDELDKIWKEFNLHHRKMILTYQVDSEELLKFLKLDNGKLFLQKAFNEAPELSKRFHRELDSRLYIDRIVHNKRIRFVMPFKSLAVEHHDVETSNFKGSEI
jgi:hypothetical protein